MLGSQEWVASDRERGPSDRLFLFVSNTHVRIRTITNGLGKGFFLWQFRMTGCQVRVGRDLKR
jgi:hypothetical protein